MGDVSPTALSILLKITGDATGATATFKGLEKDVEQSFGKQAAAVLKNNQALVALSAAATGIVASMIAMAESSAQVGACIGVCL